MSDPIYRLVLYLLEEKDGRPKGFVLQTLLEFVGIPTIASAADVLGVLRGYVNLRQHATFKGIVMIVTALLPWIPTGPVHFAVEKLFPGQILNHSALKVQRL